MKRYILFAGNDYYPSGGWDDYLNTSDDLDFLRRLSAGLKTPYYWWHIVDTTTMEKVDES